MNDLMEQMAADAAEQTKDAATLEAMGLAAWELEQRIAGLEDQVKAEKKALREMLERTIPEAMHVHGVKEFGFDTPDGMFARLSNSIRVVGSLRYAPDIEEAVAYLEASGLVGAVKTVISVDFTEAEKEDAEAFADRLLQMSNRHMNIDRDLNPSTLRSFVTGKLKEDPTWDYEKVGMTAQPIAKITTTKRK